MISLPVSSSYGRWTERLGADDGGLIPLLVKSRSSLTCEMADLNCSVIYNTHISKLTTNASSQLVAMSRLASWGIESKAKADERSVRVAAVVLNTLHVINAQIEKKPPIIFFLSSENCGRYYLQVAEKILAYQDFVNNPDIKKAAEKVCKSHYDSLKNGEFKIHVPNRTLSSWMILELNLFAALTMTPMYDSTSPKDKSHHVHSICQTIQASINQLDFSDCSDEQEMMKKIRERASRALNVSLVNC